MVVVAGVVTEAEVIPDPGCQHGVDYDVRDALDVDEPIIPVLVKKEGKAVVFDVKRPFSKNVLGSIRT